MTSTPVLDPLSPFYLDPSEGVGTILDCPPLASDGHNYKSWKQNMSKILEIKNKLAFITGDLPMPAGEDVGLRNAWKLNDRILKSWILNAINRDLHPSVTECTSAIELWNQLEVRFCGGVTPATPAPPRLAGGATPAPLQTRIVAGGTTPAPIHLVGYSFNAAAGVEVPSQTSLLPIQATLAATDSNGVAYKAATVASFFCGFQLAIYGATVPSHISCNKQWIPMVLSSLLALLFLFLVICTVVESVPVAQWSRDRKVYSAAALFTIIAIWIANMVALHFLACT